jgi:hypothetical protein
MEHLACCRENGCDFRGCCLGRFLCIHVGAWQIVDNGRPTFAFNPRTVEVGGSSTAMLMTVAWAVVQFEITAPDLSRLEFGTELLLLREVA